MLGMKERRPVCCEVCVDTRVRGRYQLFRRELPEFDHAEEDTPFVSETYGYFRLCRAKALTATVVTD